MNLINVAIFKAQNIPVTTLRKINQKGKEQNSHFICHDSQSKELQHCESHQTISPTSLVIPQN